MCSLGGGADARVVERRILGDRQFNGADRADGWRVHVGARMLVLRRRAGESVLIGDEIEIELLAISQQGVKIGIRAPRETIVLRKELKITEDQNTLAARGPSLGDLEQAIKKIRP